MIVNTFVNKICFINEVSKCGSTIMNLVSIAGNEGIYSLAGKGEIHRNLKNVVEK